MTTPPDRRRYAGAAPYYARGRLPYPASFAEEMRRALGLDGRGRLLDLGCGPGVMSLRLAGLFEQVVGVDVDEAMVAEARRAGASAGLTNDLWLTAAAEALPEDLGRFRLIVLAQSFHWMDGAEVARAARRMLEPGGVLAVVYGWSLSGDPDPRGVDPLPPYDAMYELIARHLADAGSSGSQAAVMHSRDEAEVLSRAGLVGPQRLTVPGGEVVTSTIEDVIARYLSISNSSPGAFGPGLPAFLAEADALLRAASPTGRFAERLREALVNIWQLRLPDGSAGDTVLR